MNYWPTDEQFDEAAEMGTQAALQERRTGAEEPRESPLSGEWADDVSPSRIAESVGYAGMRDSAVDELCDAWERAYFDSWAHETEVEAKEQD